MTSGTCRNNFGARHVLLPYLIFPSSDVHLRRCRRPGMAAWTHSYPSHNCARHWFLEHYELRISQITLPIQTNLDNDPKKIWPFFQFFICHYVCNSSSNLALRWDIVQRERKLRDIDFLGVWSKVQENYRASVCFRSRQFLRSVAASSVQFGKNGFLSNGTIPQTYWEINRFRQPEYPNETIKQG